VAQGDDPTANRPIDKLDRRIQKIRDEAHRGGGGVKNDARRRMG